MLDGALRKAFPNANFTLHNGCSPATSSTNTASHPNRHSHLAAPQRLLPRYLFLVRQHLHNGCFPATSSSFANMCLSKMLPLDVDLVVTDYMTTDFPTDSYFNNPKVMAFERMIRKVLKLQKQPAVIMLNYMAWGQSMDAGSDAKKAFHETAEDQYGFVAQNKDAAYLILVLALVFAVVGNCEEVSEQCFLDEQLHDLVVPSLSDGWTFINEGTEEKKKQGYVTTQPDTTLVMRFNMSSLPSPAADTLTGQTMQQQVSIMVSYLKSYEHMGMANFSCHDGCACKQMCVDAHDAEQKTSVTFMIMINAAVVADTCHLHIKTLPLTNSGEHKFKVSAVMLSPKFMEGFGWVEGQSAPFPAEDIFNGQLSKELPQVTTITKTRGPASMSVSLDPVDAIFNGQLSKELLQASSMIKSRGPVVGIFYERLSTELV
eukprot:gene7315-433_t